MGWLEVIAYVADRVIDSSPGSTQYVFTAE
jgi:hypothetical protein